MSTSIAEHFETRTALDDLWTDNSDPVDDNWVQFPGPALVELLTYWRSLSLSRIFKVWTDKSATDAVYNFVGGGGGCRGPSQLRM